MPLRRPSASATGHFVSNANSSTARVHKSQDSHHAFNGQANPSQATLHSGASPTPLQKVVQVLVNRLKNKVGSFYAAHAHMLIFLQLPCHSGLSLDVLEGDSAINQAVESLVDLAHDSLDIIAWALSELLERLAKVTLCSSLMPASLNFASVG
jgi:hypothetical protein